MAFPTPNPPSTDRGGAYSFRDEQGIGYDETSGYPSREADIDPILRKRGSNQLLTGNSHPGDSTLGPRGNTVQAGRLPRSSGPAIGAPDAINPSGRGSSSSLTD